MQKPIIFKSDSYDIYGVLHLPYRMRVDKPVPAVVFCHGFTGSKVESHYIFVRMARLLEKHGIASLRFDFRGCGDSSGDFINTTVMGEVTDTCNAVDFVCSYAGINKKKIGILGLSLGGTVAAYAAGKDPRVRSLALWAPAADLLDEAEQIEAEKELITISRLKAVDYYGTLLGKNFIDEIPKIKPVAALKNYKGSAIILHGTEDDSVPLEHSLSYYNALKRRHLKVERYLIDGADHVFHSYEWSQEVMQKTLKYFLHNL